MDPELAFRIALAVLAGLGAYRFLVPSARRRGRLAAASRLLHDAALHAKQGDQRAAGDLLDRVLTMLAELEPEAREDAAQVLVSLSQLGSRLARDDRGPARLERAHALAVQWFGADAAEALAVLSCVAALHLGRPGEALLAEQRYRSGYESACRQHGRQATQTVYWSSMTAHALWLAARLPEAEAMFAEVVRVIERAQVPDPDHAWRARCQLAAVVEARGRFAEARATLAAAVQRLEAAQPPDRAALSERLGRLGWLHFELGQYAEAEACFKRALSLGQQTGDAAPELTHRARAQLAVLYSQQARYDEAQLIYEELVAATTSLWTDVSNYAETKMLQGRLSEARGLFERALLTAAREGVPESDLRDTLRAQSALYAREGAFDEADRACQRALAGHIAAHGRDHPHTAAALTALADLRFRQQRTPEAIEAHREALALREQWLGESHPDTAASLSGLAQVLEESSPAEALALHTRALAIRRAAFPPDHPAIVESHAAVARLEAP